MLTIVYKGPTSDGLNELHTAFTKLAAGIEHYLMGRAQRALTAR